MKAAMYYYPSASNGIYVSKTRMGYEALSKQENCAAAVSVTVGSL